MRTPLLLPLLGGAITLLAGLQACAGVTIGDATTAERGGATYGPGGASGEIAAGGAGTVVAITDGDTLRLDVDGEELRVRLIGVDTPEVRDPVECYGDEATAALEALAPVGSTLGYAYDRDPQDQYGRELMYLRTAEGTVINLALVEQGAGRAVLFEPNDQIWDALQQAERDAQAAGLGLWGAC
ncbi:thermonuclease family protein [Microcella daejeonensis]|uniref:Thermonuclease family protein n=1 Tax=Microcella daejeonensis TaxID=2994971 RepID=A0A9E8MN78_9MICO|nr:thermonuclease family protein [Microcella daejeonensis]WAB82602.1 thermonuclease family protein [Microcella daejeonensis]